MLKTSPFLTRDQMEALPTKRLLAYKNSLYRIHDQPSWEETMYGGSPTGELTKQHPSWQETLDVAKEILATREHIPKKPSR